MMLTLQSIPERLAVSEAVYKSARASHDKWLARFNDERTELARLRTKREEISEEIATAKSEAGKDGMKPGFRFCRSSTGTTSAFRPATASWITGFFRSCSAETAALKDRTSPWRPLAAT